MSKWGFCMAKMRDHILSDFTSRQDTHGKNYTACRYCNERP